VDRFSPILAGLAAGCAAALVTMLLSVVLHSPDAVFFNTLTVGVAGVTLGALAGIGWQLLGGGRSGRILFAGIWVSALAAFSVAAFLAENVIEGALTYALPLASLSFAITGVLTGRLAPYVAGSRRWAVPMATLATLGLGAAFASNASPSTPALALPPPVASTPLAAGQPTDLAPAVAATTPSRAPASSSKGVAREFGHYTGVNLSLARALRSRSP
jgi:hypothetical protein